MENKVYKNRQKKLCSVLKENNLEGIIIFGHENIFYLTGFAGENGIYFQNKNRVCLFVSTLYINQAKSKPGPCETIEYKDPESSLKDVLTTHANKAIGFDSEHTACRQIEKLKKKIKNLKITLSPLAEELEFLRERKEERELSLIKKAVEYAEKGFSKTIPLFVPGTREKDLSTEMEYQIKKSGADGLAFDIIIASGKRSAFPHAVASRKKIEHGDLVIIDFGASYGGYNSDQSITITIGMPQKKQKEIYKIVRDAQSIAIESVKPGIEIRKIDEAARGYLEKYGHGKYFCHSTGHGIGINVHESPKIAKNQKGYIKEGMVITIEPGVYVPGWGGIRIEDMFVARDNFCEILTHIDKNSMVFN
ncbi:MAG: aminopeptidase P family protein [Thermodesulfobacteriota bacterium]|nr:aminopeptidase P family protein [Thermodesulfobacteriota bacterium]